MCIKKKSQKKKEKRSIKEDSTDLLKLSYKILFRMQLFRTVAFQLLQRVLNLDELNKKYSLETQAYTKSHHTESYQDP